MTNTFTPPGSFYRLMALDCRAMAEAAIAALLGELTDAGRDALEKED